MGLDQSGGSVDPLRSAPADFLPGSRSAACPKPALLDMPLCTKYRAMKLRYPETWSYHSSWMLGMQLYSCAGSGLAAAESDNLMSLRDKLWPTTGIPTLPDWPEVCRHFAQASELLWWMKAKATVPANLCQGDGGSQSKCGCTDWGFTFKVSALARVPGE